MRKILITGCNGQLGRAIQKEYGDSVEFIRTDFADMDGITRLDISNIDDVMAMCREVKPDSIINCAAMTNVDGCEKNLDGAYTANAIGPRNLAIASHEIGAKLIHISTDYVFSGETSDHPRTEFDEVGPISAYGHTKLAGENFVRQFADRYFILRTAWMYGDGKNFVKTMLGLADTHDEVTVVNDQVGTPTSAVELSKMIRFMENTESYGLYHATCEGDTNWADFTEEFYKKLGKTTRVNKVTSAEYKAMNPDSADRPKYSILDNYMLRLTTDKFRMADWHDALDVYLKNFQ